MKKGFAHSPLMTLKRVARPGSSERIGEGIIGRQASGMAFDFPAGDMSTYFASDEDGVIHKCSCSYTEQSLEDYFGHTGPVYRLKCSPFNPDVFISCSADWTMRLWEQKSTKEVYKFQSTGLNYEVKDVTWSPNNSTVFGCVTEDGRIQIWDILVDVVEPVVQVELKRELTDAEKAANDAKEKAKAEFQAVKRHGHGHGQHGEDSRHAGEAATAVSWEHSKREQCTDRTGARLAKKKWSPPPPPLHSIHTPRPRGACNRLRPPPRSLQASLPVLMPLRRWP